MPSFMKQYPILLTCKAPLQLGMKQGEQGQTRVQRQGGFPDNSPMYSSFFFETT